MKNNILGLALLTSTALVAANAQASFEDAYRGTNQNTYAFQEGAETLTNDLGAAKHDMDVAGNGATLNGNDKKGMQLKSNQKMTVHDGLTFDNFQSDKQGVVLDNQGGTFELTGDATFSNNSSTNNDGGVFYNETNGHITLKDGEHTFENNTVHRERASQGVGGAIYNKGTVEMSGTNTFKDNKADTGFGGAIHNVGQVTLDGTTSFVGNQAKGGGDLNRGGAVSNNKDFTIKGKKVTFEKNQAYAGGAVYNDRSYSNTGVFTVETEEAVFSENKSDTSGGAIFNGTDVTITGHSVFKDNEAKLGGAISNQGGTVKMGETVFDGNKAESGGALSNITRSNGHATVSFNGAVEFKNNSAETGSGGAIYNNAEGSEITMSNAKFENNTAKFGGAVMNASDAVMNLTDASFSGNTSSNSGGAYYNWGAQTNLHGTNTFENNASSNSGGAIYNDGTINIDNGGLTFAHNQATAGGGAVYNAGIVNSQADITFEGNSSEKNGGAIYNSKTFTAQDGELTFSHNEAANMGGAIYNSGTVSSQKHATFKDNAAKYGGAVLNYGGTLELKDGGDFENNKATTGGGAIYNWNKGTVTLEGNTNFVNNSTDGSKGGAIYNEADSTVEIKGDAVFSGNRVNGPDGDFNDIYNKGNVNVASNSKLTLDGGIDGNGKLVFETGSELVATAGKTTITNQVTNNGAKLTLLMKNGYKGGTVDLIGDGGSLDKNFELQNNTFYNLKEGATNGAYEVSRKSAGEIRSALRTDANSAAAVEALIYDRAPDENHQFNHVADSVSAKLQSADTLQEGLDDIAAWSPETADMVQQEQTTISNEIFGAIGSRLSSGTASDWRGIFSGENPYRDANAWVQLMGNHAKLDTAYGAHGWSSDTYGIALGLERKFGLFWKAGIGYAYGQTDIDGFHRQTDVNTNTGFVYGEYKPSNWFLNGILSYGWSDYKEKKKVAEYLIHAKYSVKTLGMQLVTGYEFFAPYGLKFVPQLGLRYLNLDQDGYTDTAGLHVSGRNSDIITGLFGAKISQPWILRNRMVITPELRIATTYDLERPDGDSVVSLPNGQGYRVKGQPLNRLGVEVGAGVSMEVNKDTDISANYEGHFRSHYQDHSGLLGMKYKL